MTLTLTYELDLQSFASCGHAVVMSLSRAKVKVHDQSVPKTEWKQTDGQTDGVDCITSLANAVGNQYSVRS